MRQMALRITALTLRPALVGCLVAAGVSAGAAMAAPPPAADCDPLIPGARPVATVRAPISRPLAAKAAARPPKRAAALPAPHRSVATPAYGTAARHGRSVAPANAMRATVKPSNRTSVIRTATKPPSAAARSVPTPTPARAAKPAGACGPSAADPVRAALAPAVGEATSASRPTSHASLLRAAGVSDAIQNTAEYAAAATDDPLAGIWTGLPGEHGPIASGQRSGWGVLGSGVIEANTKRWTGGGEGARSGMGGSGMAGSSGTGTFAEMTYGKPQPYSPGGGGGGGNYRGSIDGGNGGRHQGSGDSGDNLDLRPKSEPETPGGSPLPHTDVPLPSSLWLLLAGLPLILRAGARQGARQVRTRVR